MFLDCRRKCAGREVLNRTKKQEYTLFFHSPDSHSDGLFLSSSGQKYPYNFFFPIPFFCTSLHISGGLLARCMASPSGANQNCQIDSPRLVAESVNLWKSLHKTVWINIRNVPISTAPPIRMQQLVIKEISWRLLHFYISILAKSWYTEALLDMWCVPTEIHRNGEDMFHIL